jgi:hypothetical protein
VNYNFIIALILCVAIARRIVLAGHGGGRHHAQAAVKTSFVASRMSYTHRTTSR